MVSFPSDEVAFSWLGGVFNQFLLEAPGEKNSSSVGKNLDTGADFADCWCRLQNRDIMAGETDCDCSTETTETGSYNDYLNTH